MIKDLLEIVLSKIYIHNSESIELSNFEKKICSKLHKENYWRFTV